MNPINATAPGHKFAPSWPTTYVEVEVKKIESKNYYGLFARQFIAKGMVLYKDGGVAISDISNIPKDKEYAVEIDKQIYIVPDDYSNMSEFCYMNHSCDSNVGRIGGLIYYAKKDIAPSEELVCDYAPFVTGVKDWSMVCNCQASNCRKMITSLDWQKADVAKLLWDEWLPYIQKKILHKKL